MTIAIGAQLGSHTVTALLGRGGMGEVYLARDTKLKREVAIKILPDEFSRVIYNRSREVRFVSRRRWKGYPLPRFHRWQTSLGLRTLQKEAKNRIRT